MFSASLFSSFHRFALCGFAGRAGIPVSSSAVVLARSVVRPVLSVSGASVGVGGGVGGLPALWASLVPASRLSVFAPSSPGPAGLVSRSCQLVAWCASAGGLWVSLPVRPCPPSLQPSSSWVSCGSGSWSSLSLAAGSGCSCLVFAPGWSQYSAWPGFSPVTGGWWFRGGVSQLSLF